MPKNTRTLDKPVKKEKKDQAATHKVKIKYKELIDLKAGIETCKDIKDFTLQMRFFRNFSKVKPECEQAEKLRDTVIEKIKEYKDRTNRVNKQFAICDDKDNPIVRSKETILPNGEKHTFEAYDFRENETEARHTAYNSLNDEYKYWLDADADKNKAFKQEFEKEIEVEFESVTDDELSRIKSKHIVAINPFLPRKIESDKFNQSVTAADMMELVEKGIEIE